MKYSFVSLIDRDSTEPESLETWVMNDGAVALAYTTQERLERGVATSQVWRGEDAGVGVADFEASNEQEVLLAIEQSGLFGSNLVLTRQELEQIISETGPVDPYVIVAFEGDPLFERTYREWVR